MPGRMLASPQRRQCLARRVHLSSSRGGCRVRRGGLLAASAATIGIADAQSAFGVLVRGNAVVTGFSGATLPAVVRPAVTPADLTEIDLSGPSARVVDLHPARHRKRQCWRRRSRSRRSRTRSGRFLAWRSTMRRRRIFLSPRRRPTDCRLSLRARTAARSGSRKAPASGKLNASSVRPAAARRRCRLDLAH